MCYDILVAKLRSARSVALPHEYYSCVAGEIEPLMLGKTIEERDTLKDDVVPFALRWLKALANCPRGIADEASYNALTEYDVLEEFVHRLRVAGYDYPDWDAVLKSLRADKAILKNSDLP